jgi:hypothetical protein
MRAFSLARRVRPAALTLLGVLCAGPVTDAQVVNVGDKPEFAFSQPVANGVGVTSLADLHGRPVLVEFWGTY